MFNTLGQEGWAPPSVSRYKLTRLLALACDLLARHHRPELERHAELAAWWREHRGVRHGCDEETLRAQALEKLTPAECQALGWGS